MLNPQVSSIRALAADMSAAIFNLNQIRDLRRRIPIYKLIWRENYATDP
jgi:hypothetical protein